MFRRLRMSTAFAFALVASGIAGCSDDPSTPQTGTLRLSLIDAPTPLEGLQAVTLVVDAVRIHRSSGAAGDDGGWMDIMPDTLTVEERTFDLLELVNGVEAVLGEITLPVGTYTQIRLVLSSASLTIDDTEYDLEVPSGDTSGLKLIHPFTVHADELTALTLDFDAARSIIATPPGSTNYKLKPTIRVVQTVLSGFISGTVLPVGIDGLVLAISAATEDTVTTAHPDGVTGAYVLPALLPGLYHVIAGAPMYASAVDSNVAVTAGVETSGIDFVLQPVP